MDIGLLLAFLSLLLSIFFWWNARQQASAAEKILQEVKSQIIGWQSELNKTAIEMLTSRPEMIAKQQMLLAAQAESDFTNTVAQTIKQLSQHPESVEGQALIGRLLKHQETLVLETQRNGFNAARGASSAPSAA